MRMNAFIVGAGVLSVALLTVAMPAFAYDDPPEGSVRCGERMSISSSKHCNGGPAIVIGGCNRNGGKAGPRQTICQNKK